MERDPEEIKREIELTRERMSETAEALAYKTDVKARAQDALDERVAVARQTVSDTSRAVRETLHDVRDSLAEAAANAPALAQHTVQQARAALPDVPVAPAELARTAKAAAGEHALGIAAAATAAGFLLGLVLPAGRPVR